MDETVLELVIDGVKWEAIWQDKEDDRIAEWYIFRGGEKVGKFAGYPSSRQRVENFIRFFLAGRLSSPSC